MNSNLSKITNEKLDDLMDRSEHCYVMMEKEGLMHSAEVISNAQILPYRAEIDRRIKSFLDQKVSYDNG